MFRGSAADSNPTTLQAVEQQARREINRLYAAVLIFNLIFALHNRFPPFSPTFTRNLSLGLSILAPMLTGIFAAYRSRSWRQFVSSNSVGAFKSPPSASLFLAASQCYVGGELIWWYIEHIQHKEVPAVSWADPPFLILYVLILIAVLKLPVKSASAEGKFRALMDGTVMLAAGFAFNWYYRIGPALLNNSVGWLERIVTTAYPMGDMILITALFILWFQYRDTATLPVVRIGIIGFLVGILGDTVFAYQMQNNLYQEGTILDVTWTVSNMTFATMALAVRWGALIAHLQPAVQRTESKGAAALRTFLPYAFFPAVLALLIHVSTKAGDPRLKQGVYISAAVLLCVLLLRQIVALWENQRLYQQIRKDKVQLEAYAAEQEALNEELTTIHEELETQNLQLISTQYELEAQNEMLEQANAKLEALATTDGMTGLYNHRAFQERLHAEIARSERSQRPLAMLLLDVDKFKQYNDTFGHPAGDDALRTVAHLLKATLREVDYPARYGGEEFAVVLPDTDKAGAEQVAERIRLAIEGTTFPHRAMTVSIGIGIYRMVDSPTALIARADTALYAAKNSGRNRVIVEHQAVMP